MDKIETERAWAAGFYDGEGCCSVNKSRGMEYPIISIGQIDPEVLERFKKACKGVGKVYGPYTRKNRPRPIWLYQATSLYDVQTVIECIWPYLSTIKKEQIKRYVYVVEVDSGD